MRMISLNKVSRNVSNYDAPVQTDAFTDTDEPGENAGTAPAAAAPPAELQTPVMINVEAIRCFYPRRNEAPGTRITFTDGGGFAVAESFEHVAGLIAGDQRANLPG